MDPLKKAKLRRQRRRELPASDLVLAAMVDMLVNILIFLLNLYSTDPVDIASSADLDLPPSASEEKIELAVTLVVSRRFVAMDGKALETLVDGAGGPELAKDAVQDGVVPGVRDALKAASEQAKTKAAATGKPFVGTLLLECDRRVPYDVIRPLIATAADEGFEQIRFAVNRTGTAP